MAKAIWKDKVLAESNEVEVVEGDKYFPPDSVNKEYFNESNTQTECPRKGTAHYYHIKVEDEVNVDAAWCYPNPKEAANKIKGYVAFWRDVDVG